MTLPRENALTSHIMQQTLLHYNFSLLEWRIINRSSNEGVKELIQFFFSAEVRSAQPIIATDQTQNSIIS